MNWIKNIKDAIISRVIILETACDDALVDELYPLLELYEPPICFYLAFSTYFMVQPYKVDRYHLGLGPHSQAVFLINIRQIHYFLEGSPLLHSGQP